MNYLELDKWLDTHLWQAETDEQFTRINDLVALALVLEQFPPIVNQEINKARLEHLVSRLCLEYESSENHETK